MDKNIFTEVMRTLTSKEGVKIMRDATAVSVAGSVVGIAIRNGLYRRSKAKGGWYAKYIDLPICKKWCKADNMSVLVSAVIATTLDTVLVLDRSGVIKLRSVEDPDVDPEEAYKAKLEKAAEKAYKAEMAARATENVAETVPPSRDDIDDDEDDDDLY